MTGADDSTRWQRTKALFRDAMERPAAERRAFVEAAAGGDAGLVAAVQALLDSATDAGGPIDEAIREAAARLSPGIDQERIDHYEIERLIGEGGMGDVFLARRADGTFEQKVAIKILGTRRPGKELVQRFRAERQILANLEHPNIARLIDGGETGHGVPYLVMEYVDGTPITEYCDARRLGTRARLKLFLKACAAVQHAHQHLVIHRDIKPSNILVAADGEPKLLDFGIAKLLGPLPTEQTLVETVASSRIMTPRHASPEQVRGETVTIATDVYSLGVLLYELLSGQFPYELGSTRAAEVEQAICETDPSRPSDRLTQVRASGRELADKIAAARSARISELARQLGGDLDTIVLTAMHKEPGRRYPTVRALAEDIEHYLDHRPVRARPDSPFYRVSKFVRRNRFPVTAAATAAVIAVASTAVAFVRVAAERDAAEAERQKAEAVSGFMQGIFEVSDPAESRGEAVSARRILEEGARRVRAELAEQPDTQATMLRVLGEVYYSLGDWGNAESFLRDAIGRLTALYGEQHAEVATAKLVLGMALQDRGDVDEATRLIEEALAIREALFGRDHFDTVEAISARAFLAETSGDFVMAETYHREALAISRRIAAGDHEYLAESMTKLAGFYRIQGRNDEAEPLLLEALAMQDRLYGGEHPQSADTKRQLAGLFRETRRWEESDRLYREVIAERERMLGPDHLELAHTWNSYSQMLAQKGDLDAAVEAHQNFIDVLERATDGPHASFGAAYNNFAVLLWQQGNNEEALKYYRLSIRMQDEIDLPPRHPNRSFPLGGIANVYLSQQRYAESADLARQVLDMRREHFPESHRVVTEVKSILGAALTGMGEYAEAEQWLLDAYSVFMAEFGDSHPGVSLAATRLAELYEASGDEANALRWRELEAQALAAETGN